MDPQVLLPGEPLPAVLAGEGPLPGVHALVRLQVPRLREALAALAAAVRALARVHAHVCLQAAGRGEALPAVAADEAPAVPAEPAQLQRVQPGPRVGRRRAVREALIGPRGAEVKVCVVGEAAAPSQLGAKQEGPPLGRSLAVRLGGQVDRRVRGARRARCTVGPPAPWDVAAPVPQHQGDLRRVHRQAAGSSVICVQQPFLGSFTHNNSDQRRRPLVVTTETSFSWTSLVTELLSTDFFISCWFVYLCMTETNSMYVQTHTANKSRLGF